MAAAVKMQSDRAAFFNCRINGSATSNIYALANRQLLVGCEIYGVTNIIRGDGAVVIQRSKIILTPPSSSSENNNKNNIIIALQGRSDRRESSGFVIQGCTIKRDESYIYSPRGGGGGVVGKGGAYLGMAVAKYSRTIVMESSLGDLIHPDGWYNNKKYAIENVTFAEYGNMGPGSAGSGTNNNINRSIQVISNSSDAMRYTAGRFIQAQNWLTGTLVPPFKPGLVFHHKI
jgi:pectinesterase